MLTILRQRNFTLLWSGGLISVFGDWLLFVALPFYIYDLTGSALATGGMFVAQSLPILLFGSLGGVFADRWNRRRTMIVADVLRALLLPLLLLVRSPDWLWVIYLVMFVQSSIGQFFNPARNALIPHLVGQQHLMPANALNTLGTEVTRLIGAPLGGALVALLGLDSVVVLDSVSFLLSALLIALVADPPARQDDAASTPAAAPGSVLAAVWSDLVAGLRLVARERWLVGLFLTMAAVMLGQGITNALMVPFTNQVLHGDAQTFGWLVTAQGVGGLIGGVLIGWLGRVFSPGRIIAASTGMLGAVMFVIVNIPLLWLVLALLALAGIPVVAFVVSETTLLQSGVDDAYRGRVFGAYGTVQALMLLLGMGLASVLGDRIDITLLFNGVGGLYVLAGLLALMLLVPRRPALERPALGGEPAP